MSQSVTLHEPNWTAHRKNAPVASSRMITFAFFTSARASDTSERCVRWVCRQQIRKGTGGARRTWPTDRFAPSSSITVSKLNRFTGVCAPLGVSSPSVDGATGFTSSTRYARRSASHSVASSCVLNGSRFDRSVPETV